MKCQNSHRSKAGSVSRVCQMPVLAVAGVPRDPPHTVDFYKRLCRKLPRDHNYFDIPHITSLMVFRTDGSAPLVSPNRGMMPGNLSQKAGTRQAPSELKVTAPVRLFGQVKRTGAVILSVRTEAGSRRSRIEIKTVECPHTMTIAVQRDLIFHDPRVGD